MCGSTGPSAAGPDGTRHLDTMSDVNDNGRPVGVVTLTDDQRHGVRAGVSDRPVHPLSRTESRGRIRNVVTAGVAAAAPAWNGVRNDVGVGGFVIGPLLRSKIALDGLVRSGGQLCCPEARWTGRTAGR